MDRHNHIFSWLTKRTNERTKANTVIWWSGSIRLRMDRKSYFDRLHTTQMITFQFVQSHTIDFRPNPICVCWTFTCSLVVSLVSPPCIACVWFVRDWCRHTSLECQRNSVPFSVNPSYWLDFEFLESHHHRLERLSICIDRGKKSKCVDSMCSVHSMCSFRYLPYRQHTR